MIQRLSEYTPSPRSIPLEQSIGTVHLQVRSSLLCEEDKLSRKYTAGVPINFDIQVLENKSVLGAEFYSAYNISTGKSKYIKIKKRITIQLILRISQYFAIHVPLS